MGFRCPLKFEITDLNYELLQSVFQLPYSPQNLAKCFMLAEFSLTVNDKAEMTTEVLGDDKLKVPAKASL